MFNSWFNFPLPHTTESEIPSHIPATKPPEKFEKHGEEKFELDVLPL